MRGVIASGAGAGLSVASLTTAIDVRPFLIATLCYVFHAGTWMQHPTGCHQTSGRVLSPVSPSFRQYPLTSD